MNRAIEWRPRVTTSAGSSVSSWRRRYGAQAAISSGSGSRLSGGRHFTTFVMKTSSRRQPIEARSRTSRSPARPTNGRPWRSSLKPGPSPTKTTSVLGMALPGHRAGSALVEPAAGAGPDLRRDRLERRAALGLGHAGGPGLRGAVGALRRRTQSRSTSTSAISTAFVAAPLRRLSVTHPEREAAPVGHRGVRADAADVDLVAAGGVGGERVDVGRRVVRTTTPGTAANSSRARSGVIGSRVSTWTASEWPTKHRDADGRAGDAQVRQVEDLAALGDDLPLLLRVAVLEEDVDLREGVEGDRVRVDHRRPSARRRRGPGSALSSSAIALPPGARDRLVRVDDDALEADGVAEGHERAARAASCEQFGLAMIPSCASRSSGFTWLTTSGIARLHPPRARVVDDRAAARGRGGARSRDVPPPAEKRAMSTPSNASGVASRISTWSPVERARSCRRSGPRRGAGAPRPGSRARGGPGSSSARRRRWRRRRRR